MVDDQHSTVCLAVIIDNVLYIWKRENGEIFCFAYQTSPFFNLFMFFFGFRAPIPIYNKQEYSLLLDVFSIYFWPENNRILSFSIMMIIAINVIINQVVCPI